MKMLTIFLFVLAIKSAQMNTSPVPSCTVNFNVNNAGFDVEGSIGVIDSKIEFDINDPSHGIMEAILDPATIRTGIDIRDKHLKRSDFFDIENYPKIHVRSIRFKKTGKNKFDAEFAITIKSITKNIIVPLTVRQESRKISYTANFKINRLDFKIGEESLTLDEIVNVDVQASVNIH
ncbi:YceI family protein [Chryseolinea sp. H1M3-3]|uniref:YceI family protein n=1 Tax=Chryseolinea sp. H1M3-3 TaxID=3034144 RepID=UPI0023EDD1B5|nr:YceI family protein [Chryseolinea sp. H1M3-3]